MPVGTAHLRRASHEGLSRIMERQPPIIARTSTGGGIALSPEERERHVYIVGKSGSGKSTVLFNLAMHDIWSGQGVAVLDPHGDLAEAILDALPASRTNDVCYLNVADSEFPVGFNPLAGTPPERHALAAAGIVQAFKHLWSDSWGPRLEYFLFQGISALLAGPRPVLTDLSRVFTDAEFRDRLVRRISDPAVARFWTLEFPSYDQRFLAEAISPILNKVGQFTSSPALRNILGQYSPKFDLTFAMDNRRIFVANLAKGQIGEQATNLLGSLFISHLQLTAMARSNQPQHERVPFFCHIDEVQSFGTDALASLLSESRKFKTRFCLVGQYTEQLSPNVRAAVFGNVGTLMAFRVSAADAAVLAPEFHPLPAPELVDQPPFQAWLRRLHDNNRVAFIEPRLFPAREHRETTIKQSRRNFGRRRSKLDLSRYK
ncbi:type IV secretory system conjugative DNA transfer family protein [Bradyrhizobium guangzhouense]|nr:type IV secretion system DNA-binding domain-containing protein [Bradyrhizobium guangzhouense]